MLLRRDCKRLGDVAAATLVVHVPRSVPRTVASNVPPSRRRPLLPEDQAAIVALAARAPTLTRERLDELAALAASVSGDAGRSGPAVTRRARRRAVGDRPPMMTPLLFEQTYQAEWAEPEASLAVLAGRDARRNDRGGIGRSRCRAVPQRVRALRARRARSYPAYTSIASNA